jgi:hypothetical protein
MWKWVWRLLGLCVSAWVGYSAYAFFRAGYHTRPEMPDGAFSISFKNGMRAIVTGVPDESKSRRYFGYPSDVPYYLEDAWATCTPPTEEERPEVERLMTERDLPGERFEVVCRLQVDDDVVVRGLIMSVPRL